MREILKLERNRVWRTYTGGKLLDEFYGSEVGEDGHKPETWISSVTEAINPEYMEGEGLSFIENEHKTLKDIISEQPEYYLGKSHLEQWGEKLGILVKLLDSSERLTIQVHPDRERAETLFNSQFGKTESWIVLGGREIDGEAPHIFLGFKEGVTRESWKEVFETQDIPKMLDMMHKVYVEEGDVFLIKGGMPHAIGPGCFILEIQEPTDLTIRTEKTTPAGYSIPDKLLHQNVGFEKMFECFDYMGMSEDELMNAKLATKGSMLISYEDTPCFALKHDNFSMRKSLTAASFSVIIITSGSGIIRSINMEISYTKGDQLFIPYETNELTFLPDSETTLYQCLPPV